MQLSITIFVYMVGAAFWSRRMLLAPDIQKGGVVGDFLTGHPGNEKAALRRLSCGQH